jgi:hypothetical protein
MEKITSYVDVDIIVEMVSLFFSKVLQHLSAQKMMNCADKCRGTFGGKMQNDYLLFAVDHHGLLLSSLKYKKMQPRQSPCFHKCLRESLCSS